MDWNNLIPTPDTIPAPWAVFEFLDILTFIIHILLVNIVVGGSLITLYVRFFGKDEPINSSLHGALVTKIPTLFALGVTFGVAPLLFVQVLYGHLIYTSSVLMALFWILVIPDLIIGYYGAYIHRIKFMTSPGLSKAALLVTTLIVLYIAFMFTNNMTLMLDPSKWIAYFENGNGTILNLTDPTLFPRYFHFITASIAIAGLFSAIVWRFRVKDQTRFEKIKKGLRIFSIATMFQLLIGSWLLLSLPRPIMMLFMGKNMLNTGILTIAIILALLVIMTSIKGKLWPTVTLLVSLVVTMSIGRALVRSAYLEQFFSVDQLTMTPQYGLLFVFLITFIIGLLIIWYMIKLALTAYGRRVAR